MRRSAIVLCSSLDIPTRTVTSQTRLQCCAASVRLLVLETTEPHVHCVNTRVFDPNVAVLPGIVDAKVKPEICKR